MYKRKLDEGLRSGDLKNYVSELFTVDMFRSKMGEDQDILVLGFKVKEKHPAIDLMEFIEKGYDFILDADISAGEENDGQYQVFVEIERTPQLQEQLTELIGGLSQLCSFQDWKYRYHKTSKNVNFEPSNLNENIPMSPEEYQSKMLEFKTSDIKGFFDQGAVEVSLQENNTITFSKPFAEKITAKFIGIGDYNTVKNTLQGKLNLDESSHGQIIFLTKFLGKYDIDKIDNKFLIRNGSQGIIIEKERW